MMEQRVNFLRPRFLPEKNLLSAEKMLLGLAGVLLILVFLSIQGELEIKQQAKTLAYLQHKQAQILQQIKSLEILDKPTIPLQQKEAALKQQVAAKQELLAEGIPPLPYPSVAFSETLQQIAESGIAGLWLSEIELNNLDDPSAIKGKIVHDQPELLPQYIKQLATRLKTRQPPFSLHWMGDNDSVQNIKTVNTPISFQLQSAGQKFLPQRKIDKNGSQR